MKRRVGLLDAVRRLDFYEEANIYLNKVLQLHPYNQNRMKEIFFWAYYALYLGVIALIIMDIVIGFTGIEALGNSDILIPSYQVGFTIGAYKFNQTTLKILMKNLKKFWKVTNFDEVFQSETNAAKSRVIKYVYSYKLVILVGISFYYIIPLASLGKELPSQWYQLCDITDRRCYLVSVLVQHFCITILVIGIFTFDGIFTSIVFDVTVQLNMIKSKLRALDQKDVNSPDAYEELTLIIAHHNYVLDYIAYLNTFYSPILLSQFLSCTFSLCIGCFLLTIDGAPSPNTFIQFLSYLMALFGQVFVYCFGGQMLFDVSESIADTAYDIAWWKANIKFQKSILLLILRAQRPGMLSIGAIAEANMRMYLYASKTAFSFYTVMNQMYKDK